MTSRGRTPTTATYRIEIVDRATGRKVPGCNFTTGGVEFEFSRVLNDAGQMRLIINRSVEGCDLTCECSPRARLHEVVAFRSDRDSEAAFVGPITNVLDEPDLGILTVTALDRFSWIFGSQTTRAFDVGSFGPTDRNGEVSPVNVFGGLLADAERYQATGLIGPSPLPRDLGAVQVEPPAIEQGESTWFYLQGYLGTQIDFTVAGQNLYWGAPEIPLTNGIDLRASTDWRSGGKPSAEESGEDTASQVKVAGSSGIVGTYPPEDVDRGWGRYTLFVNDTEITTQGEADAEAQRIWEANNQPALFLISGEGSLSESANLDLASLVPGRKHRITADAGCIRTEDIRRITAVVVSGRSTQAPGGYALVEERVAVDFQPPGTESNPSAVTA